MAGEFSADLAVVIGIDAYDGAVGRLQTPVGDARAIAKLLESRFGYEVILRCDGEATRESLWALLHEELPRRVRKESRLLFYFAGHGVAQDSAELEGPRGFLVPQNAGPTVDTHLPMDKVREALAGLPCRHLLVVLDCCFAGSFHWAGMRPLYMPDELLYEERYRHWVRNPASWALASSAHDEYALDRPDRRRGQTGCHSPFATALLAGIAGAADRYPEGGDGIVTLAELYAYVRERLAPHQSPLLAPLKRQTRGEYVFRDPRQPLTLRSAEAEVRLDEGANPYRGLEAYRPEDAELFFGRGDAAHRLLRHVRQHPLTVVAGPSGSGKSSLVQAGLLSRLRARHRQRGGRTFGWIVAPLPRMAADPLAVLREGLAAAGGPPLPDTASLNDEAVAAWAADWAKLHPGERLLVVVDQAEELITRVTRGGSEASDSIPEAATHFLSCLAALLGTGRMHVLIAVRSDYEPDLDDGPLASRWSAGRFVLPPLSRGDLRQIVEGPAARKALYFDDPRLVDRLVDEVVGMPGGLPLLSYALSRLYLAYLKAGRGDRLLTADDLKSIGGEAAGGEGGPVAPGGIMRILREAADGAVKELPLDQQETLWRVLLRMVSLTGARATRRQVPMRELDYPGEDENRRVDTVLTQLTNEARLLVRDLGAGDGVVEPAHDELLVAWPALVRKIDEARVRLPVHRRLGEAATEWDTGAGRALGERRRTRDLDLRLLGLVEASGLPSAWLNRVEAEYLAAARQERRLRAVRRWTAVAAALLLTTGAALFFLYLSQRNQRLRYQASIQGLVNQGEADLGTGNTARALLLARQAYDFLPLSKSKLPEGIFRLLPRIDENDLGARVDGLFRRVLDDLPPSRVVLQDSGPIAFDPSGRLLAAGYKGDTVLLALPETGLEVTGQPHRLPGAPPGEGLEEVAFSTDGRFLAAGFASGSLCVWRLARTPPVPSPEKPACAPPPAGPHDVSGLAFRPGAATLVVGRKDGDHTGSIQVWAISDDPSGVLRLELSSNLPAPGGARDLTVSPAGELLTQEDKIRSLCEGTVTGLAMDARGDRVAVACDGILRLWDLRSAPGGWVRGTGRNRLTLTGAPTVLAASPGAPAPLAVGNALGDVELYNPATGERSQWKRPVDTGLLGLDPGALAPNGKSPGVAAIVWSPPGEYYVLGSDGLQWRVSGGTASKEQWLGGRVCKAAASADGAWLAVLVEAIPGQTLLEVLPTSGDGKPVLLPQKSTFADRCLAGLAFHPARTELAVGLGNEITLWSPSQAGPWRSRELAEAGGPVYAVAWAGDLLAVGGRSSELDGSVELRLGGTGELQRRWTVPGAPVNGLAFSPGGKYLAAGTDHGGLRVWSLAAPESPPVILGKPDATTEFPAFLGATRVAALNDLELSVWSLGTQGLAEASCATAAANLKWNDWTAYVSPSLEEYEKTCPALDPHSSVLSRADSLAAAGDETAAKKIYVRLNELKPGTVVNAARRARGERMWNDLSAFDATDRAGVLAGMERAGEYDGLRRAEGLLPLAQKTQLRLCRRGAVFGEARRALPFCEGAIQLLPRDGYAHDSRGLTWALLGNLRGAREDFMAARDWLEDPGWRAKRQTWIKALDAGRNPITPEVLREIARDEGLGGSAGSASKPNGLLQQLVAAVRVGLKLPILHLSRF